MGKKTSHVVKRTETLRHRIWKLAALKASKSPVACIVSKQKECEQPGQSWLSDQTELPGERGTARIMMAIQADNLI